MLRSRTGATVVVENRTGANGVLAADYVAKSAPDGYTVYLGFQGTQSVLPHVDPKLPYDPGHDFAPVVLIAMGPAVLVVNPTFPARTVKELIELAKPSRERIRTHPQDSERRITWQRRCSRSRRALT